MSVHFNFIILKHQRSLWGEMTVTRRLSPLQFFIRDSVTCRDEDDEEKKM